MRACGPAAGVLVTYAADLVFRAPQGVQTRKLVLLAVRARTATWRTPHRAPGVPAIGIALLIRPGWERPGRMPFPAASFSAAPVRAGQGHAGREDERRAEPSWALHQPRCSASRARTTSYSAVRSAYSAVLVVRRTEDTTETMPSDSDRPGYDRILIWLWLAGSFRQPVRVCLGRTPRSRCRVPGQLPAAQLRGGHVQVEQG